ncbi:stage II sporulation protein D [Paenibacillus anaericanus]|uniref:stage II sporulation protein D n=1 Tax=Paenibacillus anaericanus TaxID=170367 RepID=UPI00278AD9B7|nr:stage II sporulation protein D [Paenibacillus anaericanus]MDQ0089851.1 stage II sporulation protein D [Paenibacillus anaericanus]
MEQEGSLLKINLAARRNEEPIGPIVSVNENKVQRSKVESRKEPVADTSLLKASSRINGLSEYEVAKAGQSHSMGKRDAPKKREEQFSQEHPNVALDSQASRVPGERKSAESTRLRAVQSVERRIAQPRAGADAAGAGEQAVPLTVPAQPTPVRATAPAAAPTSAAAPAQPTLPALRPLPPAYRVPATRTPARAPLRGSFRLRGRNLGKLAAAVAALTALAVLLPALLTGRAAPPATMPVDPAAQSAAPQKHLPSALDSLVPGSSGLASTTLGPLTPGSSVLDPTALGPHTFGSITLDPTALGSPAVGGYNFIPSAFTPAASAVSIHVYLSDRGVGEILPLEQYVAGVLAAEMPADFEMEALKAQAIAARTFIVRRLVAGDSSGVPTLDADVTDTVAHQAYLSKQDLRGWVESGKSEQLAKLQQAVRETSGMIMTYRGEPITASFFSASGGYTENSEEYWTSQIPYLRSVPSPWEAEINPHYKETITLPLSEMFGKLGLRAPALPAATSAKQETLTMNKLIKILSLTSGGKVKSISIGGEIFTGREVREKLKLRSSQFTFKLDGKNVNITTYGYGHGVGMSQWGANGMAKEGYTSTQILKHYYTGISFRQTSLILKN